MLTLFAIPKPFIGNIGVIQRNAIGSWTRLGAGCEVLLFGDEAGTAEIAREHGVHHVPDVARNERCRRHLRYGRCTPSGGGASAASPHRVAWTRDHGTAAWPHAACPRGAG